MTERELALAVRRLGGTLYRVGGPVRDERMGVPAKDRDYVAVGLMAAQVEKRWPEAVKTGKAFPVYRLRTKWGEIELALARTERKTGHGHTGFDVSSSPEVTLEQDLARRDLTMNAMAVDVLTGRLVDPFNGTEDLRARTLRAVSSAFGEDPLRVYRVARFAAALEFSIEPGTVAQMRDLRSELRTLSPERVWMETLKALKSRRPSIYFRALEQADALEAHFPELAGEATAGQGPDGERDGLERILRTLDAAAQHSNREDVRFAALLCALVEGAPSRSPFAERVIQRLCGRLRTPEKWRRAAQLAATRRVTAEEVQSLPPLAIVELLTAAEKSAIGVEGFCLVSRVCAMDCADAAESDLLLSALPELWQQVTGEVNGRTLHTDARGKAFGDALRQERARRLNDRVKALLP